MLMLMLTQLDRVCSLQFPRNGNIGKGTVSAWWGNTVWQRTADFRSIPLKRPDPGAIFGYVILVSAVFVSLLTGYLLCRPSEW